MTRLVGCGALALSLALLAGCGEDADEGALAALADSRDDVRSLAEELRDDVVDDLAGREQQATGGWESCVSARNETGTTFRYSASVRMTTTPPGRRLLGPVAEVVESAGLRRTVGQADEVRATGGDLEVVFWALPDSTDGDLLVTVAGPCLEAPEAARDDFAARVGPDEGLD